VILTEVLRKAVHLYPNKRAIVCEGDSWTYAGFGSRVDRLSQALLSLGVERGDRVAILHRNCHRFLECYFGVMQIGGVLVPMNYRLSPSDWLDIITDSGAKILVVDEWLRERMQSVADLVSERCTLVWAGDGGTEEGSAREEGRYELLLEEASSARPPPAEIGGDDIAQIYYTSGTTGRGKGVVLTHRNVYVHALGTIAEFQLTDGDVWIHAAPLFHLADGWATWSITWVGGVHVLVPDFREQAVLEAIEREGVTITNMIPTMLNALVNYSRVGEYDYSSLRLLLSGGAPIAGKLVERIMETFGCEYAQTYGMTETSPYLTVSTLKDHLAGLSREEQIRFRAKAGREFITVELRVVNAEGEDVEPDGEEVGEIIVRGDGVTSGYGNLPEATEEAIKDGWLYTGDVAVIDGEGYVHIVDRKRDMIITGGENVYSVEVENVLYSHPWILEAAVIGVPDEQWGEAVTAIVVLKEGQDASEEEIIQFCKEKMATFKAPKSVDFVSDLPKTGSGKISKSVLREDFWKGRR
jgi:acyl-CoA synthetase (AMP-forming)/AMP-acid ligase II